MKVANARVYALTNHSRVSTETFISVWMTGNALVITRLLRAAMNIGSPVARRTRAREAGRVGWGIECSPSSLIN
jgi:hypothetical protein